MGLVVLLLSLSLGLPFCCHTDISKSFSHNQSDFVQAGEAQHPDSSECNCGHQLRKDFQKKNKQITSIGPDVLSTAMDTARIETSSSIALSYITVAKAFRDLSQPPLHLLNSVFLN